MCMLMVKGYNTANTSITNRQTDSPHHTMKSSNAEAHHSNSSLPSPKAFRTFLLRIHTASSPRPNFTKESPAYPKK